jgi:hypothetical protein
VVASPDPGNTQQFLTSDQCLSCHAGLTQRSAFGPVMFEPYNEMLQAETGQSGINLSPFGEWEWSIMGLAGRDPIFYAQLESEIKWHPANAELIQDTCLRCHGVMGQRQFHLDNGPDVFYLEDVVFETAPELDASYYGALSRDGISCMVCHQIDAFDKLHEVLTGQFNVSGRNAEGYLEIKGPFDAPKTLSMASSLGLEPVQDDFITSSKVCASCHTIYLPVFDDQGHVVKEDFEQVTYLEWLNSDFQNELGDWKRSSSDPRSCQSCHMPTTFHNPNTGEEDALVFKIAAIQDHSYPESDHLAPVDAITLEPRNDFARHTLLGINVFVLEMFNQFDDVLGVRKTNYFTNTKGIEYAIEVSARQAREASADVVLQSVDVDPDTGTLTAVIQVTNLTGHRFPSGVGFRRAFLEFQVLDERRNVVWASGRTNSLGIIVDQNGQPLSSEFFETVEGVQQYEPHYQTITAQNQVQIFQELTQDSSGIFTDSFVGRFETIKDNRLLPKGWSEAGPPGFMDFDDPPWPERYLKATMPEGGARQDPDFTDGTGSDTITYQVALSEPVLEQIAAGQAVSVQASVYYQAIPPFYLMTRFVTNPDGPGALRLYFLASHLKLEGTPIENWKLLVDSDNLTLNPSLRGARPSQD